MNDDDTLLAPSQELHNISFETFDNLRKNISFSFALILYVSTEH